jgi:hypothetical protein
LFARCYPVCFRYHSDDVFTTGAIATAGSFASSAFRFHSATSVLINSSSFFSDPAINGCDIRVVQQGEDLRLAFDAGKTIRVERKFRREDPECDIAIEALVVRMVHLAHSTPAPMAD